METDKKQKTPSSEPPAPMWKTFMVTDIQRIERVSGQLHAKAQPIERQIGMLGEKDLEPMFHKGPEKPNTVHEREVVLKPAVLGVSPGLKQPSELLPSRKGEFLMAIGSQSDLTGKQGILASRLKGYNEKKEKEQEKKE
jgi:hypothetical protein